MGLIDEGAIRQTAEVFGIDDHSLVEKVITLYSVLKALGEVDNSIFKWTFARGTAFATTNCISEDIDVEPLINDDSPAHLLTRSQLCKQRKELVKSAPPAVEKIDGLEVASKLSRNENGLNQLEAAYPTLLRSDYQTRFALPCCSNWCTARAVCRYLNNLL